MSTDVGGRILDIVAEIPLLRYQVRELKAELETSKQAYADLMVNSGREIRILKDEIQELEQQL